MSKKLLLIAAALACMGQIPYDPCVFRISIQLRVTDAGGTQYPGVTDPTVYGDRATAQARAQHIVARGYQHVYYPPGGTAVPASEIWFPAHAINHVQITPIAVSGDPGQCISE